MCAEGKICCLEGSRTSTGPSQGQGQRRYHSARKEVISWLPWKSSGSSNDAENASPSLWQSRVPIRVLHRVMSEAVRGTFPRAPALHQRHVSGGDKPESMNYFILWLP